MTFSCSEVAQAAGLQPGKKVGQEVLYTCPRHEDKHPSLSIHPGKNVWMCGPCAAHGNAWKLAAFIGGVNPDDRSAVTSWLRDHGLLNGNGQATLIVATYDYVDEAGALLYQIVRKEPKGFRQRRPDGNGGWVWNIEGVRRVPYRLPEWKDKPIVYIVEGEKDADALWKLGIPATCNPMGAGKWRDDYDQYFKGKRVVIFPDNDVEGEKHAKDVARHLLPVAEAVKIVRLPNLPPKGDVSDWIVGGGTREQLAKILSETPQLTQVEVEAWGAPNKQSEERSTEPFRYTSVSDIPAVHEIPKVDIEWVAQGLIPRKSVTVLAAVPGGMKSYLALDIARRVAAGESFAGRRTTPLDVLYLDRENPDSVVRERLEYLGIRFVPRLRYWGGWLPEWPPHPDDPRIIEFARSGGLIVIDSLIRFSSAKDENDSAQMAVVMERLRQLQRHGATVLVLHHASEKSEHLCRGSSEILGGCDELYNIRKVDDFTVELQWKVKTRFGVDKQVALKREPGGFVATEVQPGVEEKMTAEEIYEVIFALIGENSGLNKSALVDLAEARGIRQKDARAALAKMENDPRVRVEEGARGAKLYYQAYDPVEEAAF